MDTEGHREGSCLGKRERICSQPVGPLEPEVGTLGVSGPGTEEQRRLSLWAGGGCVAVTRDSQRRGASHETGLGGCEWMSSHMWVGKDCCVLQGSEIKILRKTSEVKASCIPDFKSLIV